VLPNEPQRVPEIRRFVGSYLADLRAPVEVSGEILLAVGEAAANAARHGRRPTGRSEIRVRCAMKGRDVTITVADDGPGFVQDPDDEPELPDRYASGGRGLYLMREFMDEVDLAPTPEGTTVTLVRRLWPEG
jgi:serine/threonine-protein kinase RsbW